MPSEASQTNPNEPAQLSSAALGQILAFQQNEVTEAVVYRRIAACTKEEGNRSTLLRIADEEARHAEIWQRYTGRTMKPERGKVARYSLIARVFGFTFAVKLMERGEAKAQVSYEELAREVPEALDIRTDEEAHEHALLDILDEERLGYVGSMVLGMNDALVEMTGTLAGLTLAMQNTRLIALSGLITGIAATLSMASSEYLSSKTEGRSDALKSAAYTGVTYLVTVTLLILPYLLFDEAHYLWALGTMICIVLLILVVFNYYLSVAQDLSFKKRFGQMAGISLGVAALSFVIGIVVKMFLGVDV
ncbi:MAG: VIT1/CCC1 transporter family protein [Gordonibacter sp.]